MNIQIHADEIGRNLVEENHDVQACCLNHFFETVIKEYNGGYHEWTRDMANLLSGNALLAMEDILKKKAEFSE